MRYKAITRKCETSEKSALGLFETNFYDGAKWAKKVSFDK
jgi:hypothetical protein